jgi:hypothetical protein
MAAGNKVWDEYASVVGTRRPLTGTVDYVGSNRYVRGVRHCLMPFSTIGDGVNVILVAVEIDRGRGTLTDRSQPGRLASA